MSWAKFDDRYDDNKKIKRLWRCNQAAVAIHAMAITYASRHETDGVVEMDWLMDKLPRPTQRKKVLDALVSCGLFEASSHDSFVVHDFLDFNPSRASKEERRKKDRDRKSGIENKGSDGDFPRGIHTESDGTPNGKSATPSTPSRPGPSQPDPARPTAAADGRPHLRSVPTSDDYPKDLPAALHPAADRTRAILQRVADHKNAKPITKAAVGRALTAYPTHDHVTVAGEFEHFWVHGRFEGKKLRDVVLAYRNRLSDLPAPTTAAPLAATGLSPDAAIAAARAAAATGTTR